MMKAVSNKKYINFLGCLIAIIILIIFQNAIRAQVVRNESHKINELKAVEEVIHNVFGWAVKKNFDLFFQTIADDSNIISVTPYNRVKFGINDVKKDSAFWGSPHFKALRHEVHNLKIQFSSSGDVA